MYVRKAHYHHVLQLNQRILLNGKKNVVETNYHTTIQNIKFKVESSNGPSMFLASYDLADTLSQHGLIMNIIKRMDRKQLQQTCPI